MPARESDDRNPAPGNPRDEGGSEPEEPSRRLSECDRAACEAEFESYRPNQKYCSENCRKRAWEERRRRKLARHVARELLDPERIEESIASFED